MMAVQTFFYGAHAIPLALNLTQPARAEAHGAVALPSIGGEGRRQGVRYPSYAVDFEGIRLKDYNSSVTGFFSDKTQAWETEAMVELIGLNIHDVVTADRLAVRLVSQRVKGEDENRIAVLSFAFEGLRIDGRDIKVVKASQPTRWSGFLASSESVMAEFGFADAVSGNVISVPHFGTVEIARIFRTPQAARITMLRIEHGCSCEGTVVCGECEADGHTYPPLGFCQAQSARRERSR